MFPPHTFAKQPLKALYLIYQIFSTLFVRIPIWFLLAIPPWMRQRKSWGIQREVMVKLIRHLFSVIGLQVGPLWDPDHRNLVLWGGLVKGLWIPPVPKGLVVGEIAALAETAQVQPIRIPGYWYHSKSEPTVPGEKALPGEKILLYFHGGGYIRLSAHPSDSTSAGPKGFIEHKIVRRALSVEYRLSSTNPLTPPTHPFPAALLDGLSGYIYLVETLGFSPDDVIISGDSAGGNLSQALARYLCENTGKVSGLPRPPSALVLISPWTDLYDKQGNNPNSSMQTCLRTDYLIFSGEPMYYERAFTGVHGIELALRNRYISPAGLHPELTSSISFKGFPRTFIFVGGAEILHDQIMRFKDRLEKDIGEESVGIYRAADGVHDFALFSWHEPERSEAFKAVASWL
ncbi:endoplasmic reticulum protein [Flagelloscypha sp. PMI_526]|nr:endoplasmic reticulum protein [Flagelloscypha sp. PMI_526]